MKPSSNDKGEKWDVSKGTQASTLRATSRIRPCRPPLLMATLIAKSNCRKGHYPVLAPHLHRAAVAYRAYVPPLVLPSGLHLIKLPAHRLDLVSPPGPLSCLSAC